MKLIRCKKCRSYFQAINDDYEWPKCTRCGSTDLEETLYKSYGSTIDWEHRRYEIAKGILANSHIAHQLGHYSYIEEDEVKDAVRMADLLIEELKRG